MCIRDRHGTARYVDEGDEFAEQKKWADGAFAAMGVPIQAKGGCFVHVDAVYTSKAVSYTHLAPRGRTRRVSG